MNKELNTLSKEYMSCFYFECICSFSFLVSVITILFAIFNYDAPSGDKTYVFCFICLVITLPSLYGFRQSCRHRKRIVERVKQIKEDISNRLIFTLF